MSPTALLSKPARGWKYDLPCPNDPPIKRVHPSALSNPPNHSDLIYLELPRQTMRLRGVAIWLSFIFALLAIIAPLAVYLFITTVEETPPFFPSVCLLLGFAACFWGSVYYWRMDIEAPLDEPIRFNRARRKVYVYRFHHDGLRLFGRSAWGVTVEAYNWDDLHAEACSIYGPMGTGGLIETVTLAVLEPGTNKVIERFHFAHEIQQGEMYWAMAQLFMQQGPHALPTFDRPPRDWNNEDVTFNLARRLAPKVKWPADLDLESRTSPEIYRP